jgi:hypothetical protein
MPKTLQIETRTDPKLYSEYQKEQYLAIPMGMIACLMEYDIDPELSRLFHRIVSSPSNQINYLLDPEYSTCEQIEHFYYNKGDFRRSIKEILELVHHDEISPEDANSFLQLLDRKDVVILSPGACESIIQLCNIEEPLNWGQIIIELSEQYNPNEVFLLELIDTSEGMHVELTHPKP